MSSIDTLFSKALQTIQTVTQLSTTSSLPRPALEERIVLYGLFKQASQGNIDYARPTESQGAIRKWEAWKQNEGLKKEEAKLKYVRLLLDMLENYDDARVIELRRELYHGKIELDQQQQQINFKAPKYGYVGIERAQSPAASLYRIASGYRPASRQSFSRSRQGSFSGVSLLNSMQSQYNSYNTTAANYAQSSLPTESTSNNNIINNAPGAANNSSNRGNNNGNGNGNSSELARWQADINDTLGKIMNELANLKSRSVSEITVVGGLNNKELTEYLSLHDNKAEAPGRIRWLLTKIRLLLMKVRAKLQEWELAGLWKSVVAVIIFTILKNSLKRLTGKGKMWWLDVEKMKLAVVNTLRGLASTRS
ncbi:hypothetical protein DAMA08_017500 [Martiniozyma asiatica (nom. inval.)]|nr:hypothetical protein DAMA08_017500 [Martiniozyma asiatica]